jgi:glycosyltransferase involved in cell wall biosynthesis
VNILLITPLYPGYINQSKIDVTYAVHNIAKEWTNKNEVKVLRLWPYYPNLFKFFKKTRRMNQYKYEEEFTMDDVRIFRIPILKFPKLSYRYKDIEKIATKFIKTIGKASYPDVIICDTLNPSIYIGKIIASKCDSILIASLHNTDIVYLSNNKNYKKYIKIDENIDKIVFRSEKIKKMFLRLYDGNKNEQDYLKILFGINKTDVIKDNKLKDKILSPNKVITVASSLKKLKNINILIEAFTKLENRDGYILKIIGDGPERKRLEELVKNSHYETKVIFEGAKPRDYVLKAMEDSYIFAMASSPETFGLVYIEAMAKGCITIGSKGEGIDGVIIDNKNGFLCNPNDVEDLKITLEKAIDLNLQERKKIINNAVNTARQLNNEDLASNFLKNIKDTIENRS